jgi:hypothetical protein
VHQNATQVALDGIDAASDGGGGNAEAPSRGEEALVTVDGQQDA